MARRRWFSRKYPICICLTSNSKEKEDLNKYAIVEDCEEESIDKTSMSKGSIGKASVSKASFNKEKISFVNEEEFEIEVGKEADGYLSDASTESESGKFFY